MKLAVEAHLGRLEATIDVDCHSLGVVGPSGAGKSTLLDVIAGIEPGRVVLDGRDLTGVAIDERRIGLVPQESHLFPHLSVRENLAFAASDIDFIASALQVTTLLDRPPRILSGGEKRRVALGRALASEPSLLLLDEPFAGLDALRRREAMALLADVRRRFNVPMVVVSHVPEEIIGLTDQAIRLDGGRVVASGASPSVLRAGETEIDCHFEGEVVAPGRVRVGSTELAVSVAATGRVRLGCYARDVILATEMPRGLSARNCVWTGIESVTAAGDAVLIALNEPPVKALVTREAATALELGAGKRVVAIIKATSIAYLGTA